MAIVHITQEYFDELVLNAPGKVMLDFWATWCGPCRMIAPLLEQIAEEHEELTIGKIDVDAEGALAARFGIVSIPTLVVMEGGQAINTAVGYRPKNAIEKLLED